MTMTHLIVVVRHDQMAKPESTKQLKCLGKRRVLKSKDKKFHNQFNKKEKE